MSDIMSNPTNTTTPEHQDGVNGLSNAFSELGLPVNLDREQLRAIARGEIGMQKALPEDIMHLTKWVEAREHDNREAMAKIRSEELKAQISEDSASGRLQKILGRHAVLPQDRNDALVGRMIDALEKAAELRGRSDIYTQRVRSFEAVGRIVDRASAQIDAGELENSLSTIVILQEVHRLHVSVAKKVDQLLQNGDWRQAVREGEKFGDVLRGIDKGLNRSAD